MYAGGTRTAQSRMKIPDMVTRNLLSCKPLQSRRIPAEGSRGKRVLSVLIPRRKHVVLIPAKIRSVQGNPTRETKAVKSRGIATPPKPAGCGG